MYQYLIKRTCVYIFTFLHVLAVCKYRLILLCLSVIHSSINHDINGFLTVPRRFYSSGRYGDNFAKNLFILHYSMCSVSVQFMLFCSVL